MCFCESVTKLCTEVDLKARKTTSIMVWICLRFWENLLSWIIWYALAVGPKKLYGRLSTIIFLIMFRLFWACYLVNFVHQRFLEDEVTLTRIRIIIERSPSIPEEWMESMPVLQANKFQWMLFLHCVYSLIIFRTPAPSVTRKRKTSHCFSLIGNIIQKWIKCQLIVCQMILLVSR